MKKIYNFILFLFPAIFMYGQGLISDGTFSGKVIDNNKAVGVIAGSGSVSLGGTANYSIPIYTPDAVNGMVPGVSISYSSGAGNGLLGYGWSLGAYSVITYDTKNIYNDGIVAPNYINSVSPYLLDGTRLILYSTSPLEYRTESESFSKIVPNNAVNPTVFTITTKSGIVMEYSERTNASSGKTITWYLKKSTDPYGNSIEYAYSVRNGEKVLDTITYNKNPNLNTDYNNRIQFVYAARPDSNVYYALRADSSMIDAQWKKNRLTSIEVYSEDEKMKKYDFIYGTDTLYSYLNEVKETGYNSAGASAELNSTIFKYGNTNTDASQSGNFSAANKKADLFPADFNGDGLDDMFIAYYTQTGSYPKKYSDYKMFLRNSTGTGFSTDSVTGSFPATEYWSGGTSGTVCSLYVELYVSDVDGNGRKDITIVKRGKNSLSSQRLFGAYVLYGNAAATAFNLVDYSDTIAPGNTHMGDITGANYFLVGDFDGDSRTDWITYANSSVKVHFPAKSEYNKDLSYYDGDLFETYLACNMYYANNMKVADFDGDGKDDIIYSRSAGGCGDASTGVHTITKDGAYYIDEKIADNISVSTYFADFNGDGKTDMFYLSGGNNWKIRYATGKTHSAEYTYTAGETISGTDIFKTGDFNGDGKDDILHYYLVSTTHNMVIYYSSGRSFKRVLSTFTFPTTYRPFTVGDFNGDGRDDLLDTIAGNTGACYIQLFNPKGQERLLTKIKDGYERVTEFQYKLCTETGGMYTLSASESYPLKAYVPRTFKVNKMITPDGSGNMSNITSTQYTYANAVTHLAGKGYLGLKSFKAKDSLTTLTSEQTNAVINNNTSFYLFGGTTSKTYYAGTPTTLLTKDTAVYDIKDYGSKRYLLKNTQTTAWNYVADAKVVSTAAINDEGNMTSSTSTMTTVGGTPKQTTTTSVNQYLPVASGGIPVLPDEVTTTVDYAGATGSYTTTTKTTYTQGQPLQITLFKNSSGAPDGSRVITKDFEYDTQFGILLKVTTTPSSITSYYTAAPRYERYEYFPNKRTLKKTFVSAPVTGGELCTQEITAYDARLNLPTQVKHGYYGNIYTDYEYDAFGRTTKITQQPNGIVTNIAYSFETGGTNGVVKTETTQTSAPEQTTYSDRFGRVVKSGAKNFSDNYVWSTTTYNSFGNIATATAPDATNAGSGNITNTYYYHSINNYYRLDKINNSISGNNVYSYLTSGGATATRVTNQISNLFKEQTIDITGKLVAAADNNGAITYTYNSQGNVIQIDAPGGVSTIMTYDDYTGAQTSLSEVNSGTTNYKYNGFGELVYQKDAKNFEYKMTYDVLGRLTKKERLNNTTVTPNVTGETLNYEYVSAGNSGAQQLQYVKIGSTTKQTYGYDGWHRPVSYSEVVDGGNTFTTTTAYKNDNSIDSITYPNSYSVKYSYTTNGYFTGISSGAVNIYTTTGTNKYNQPTGYTLGNTKSSAITYGADGNPTNYTTTGIQNLDMVFNANTGSMTSRTDNTKSPVQTESFTYEYDRLKTITTNSGTPRTNSFAANGNISTKEDAGTYSYHGTKKHAVTGITLSCTSGSLNYREGQTITYTPFGKAATIQQKDTVGTGSPTPKTYLVSYSYNPDEDRNKSELKIDNVTKNIRYYHGNYERLDTFGSVNATKHIYYLYGGNGLCAIATKDGTNPVAYQYVYTDHLGSILKLTNSTGTVLAEQSFDAWGRLRYPNKWDSLSHTQPANSPFGANGLVTNGGWLTRGYTGHEHVPQVDLINMNGRMYDAVLGRMLSPDNFVADPTNTQAYNRYSYVINNPLKYTDPSGWFLKAREEGREIAFPDVPHKGEEYGGCPGGFFNSSIFNYNFQGSYSSYVSNQGYYSFIYGTQTGMQAAVQAGYVQSKIKHALYVLTHSSKWKWTGRSGNEGSAGEQKERNINRTWTFGGDGGSSIDWGSATASDNPYIGLQTSSPRAGYNTVSNINNVNDIIGIPLGTTALKVSEHIKETNYAFSFGKWGKPFGDGTYGLGNLTGKGVLVVNRTLKIFGTTATTIGLLSSFYLTVAPNPVTHKKQSPLLLAADVVFARIGNKLGPYGFAASLGWSFVAKPTLQMTPEERRQWYYFNHVNGNSWGMNDQPLFFK